MKNSRFLVCLILLCVMVLLNLPAPVSQKIKSDTRDNVAPFQNVWSYVVESWSNTFSALAGSKSYIIEKKALLEEVQNLKFQLAQVQRLKDENDELKRLLKFKEAHKYKLTLCDVIARGDSSGWWHTITLNKGSKDGIESNCAVITEQGLIGTTIKVSDSTAEVLLIVDQNCRVACKFERTGMLGILQGSGVSLGGDPKLEMLWNIEQPKMAYIDKDHELIDGDSVVTSGLGGVYPEGLVVGKMTNLRIDKSELYYRADILLAANVQELKFVFVVK